MVELNLLPDVKKEFIKAQRTRTQVISVAIVAMIASVGLTVLFASFVYVAQPLIISNLTSDIKDKSQELKSVEEIDKYLTVQNQLANLQPLHDDKPVYSRLLDYLPSLNPSAPNNITLTSMELDQDATTVTFQGTAKTFESFNIYKDTLLNANVSYKSDGGDTVEEKMFTTVTVESSSLGQTVDGVGVSFTVIVEYNPAAFAFQSESVSVSVPNVETTQSVRQSPVFNGSGAGE